MDWSFTKLETYLNCPKAFWQNYLDPSRTSEPLGNAFSDYGLFVHKLLEKWATGELERWQ